MIYVGSLPIQLFIGVLLPLIGIFFSVPVFIGIFFSVPVFIGIFFSVPVFIGIFFSVPVFMAIFLPFLPFIFVCLWWWCLKNLVFTSFMIIMAVFLSLTTTGPALTAAAVTDIKKQTASKIPSVFFICFNIFLSPFLSTFFI